MPSWANKGTYTETPLEAKENKKQLVMYIPISELTQDLDVLKTIARLELPITL
ncbi:4874_t:CDS:1, partial [Dentiscutata heterogama]